jgi:hypothetical protein
MTMQAVVSVYLQGTFLASSVVHHRAAAVVADVADVALAAVLVDANLPDMRRRLTSASKRGQALASMQLQLLYHTRSEAETATSCEVSWQCWQFVEHSLPSVQVSRVPQL